MAENAAPAQAIEAKPSNRGLVSSKMCRGSQEGTVVARGSCIRPWKSLWTVEATQDGCASQNFNKGDNPNSDRSCSQAPQPL